MLRKLIDALLLYRAQKRVSKNATFYGNSHKYSTKSNVVLLGSATKENVVLHDHCWCEGKIYIEGNGRVEMHPYSKIGPTTKIMCVNKVVIGAYTAIADDTTLCDNNNHPISPSYRKQMRLTPKGDDMRMWKHSANAPIIIGENCWIGTNVRICKGVTIGDNSIVAACSVVIKDVPANCIVAGNPAKIVKTDIDKEDRIG